ncbi:RagB/SusD family nutrient uptake outer membrane protein [Flavobacterium sp. DG2-3]|uniref:RagB/SusD family nutrient uptake outer membrane protein n=1 Tax=Flavobacterium sp. DG2-3 TaxID=3068317 RepID=UPI00273D6367|nr:RagB/SusD family nutrient uptake outer membrane protein [Flavobacterium sp. DG2-3]MDP5198992.1 RagB/SusD family nutrient uptake outer membrane protein [Flavobacterium sp. DG2-3]
MKTIYRTTKFILFLCITTNFASCDSFVEVDLPKSQLTSVAVFEDYATADAALTDIYSKIRDIGMLSGSGYGISNQLGNYTDELTSNENPGNTSIPFFHNSLLPSNTVVAGYWNSAYNQIYAANAIIEGLEASTTLSSEQKNQLKGEALFIRSLLHLYLLNIFGDIPYITQTDYKENRVVTRMPSSRIYESIILDLQQAVMLLPASDNLERTRPNQSAAKTLLARTYLYNNSYPEAANMASAVLNEQDSYLLEDITEVFLINSKETIWQLQSGTAGRNTAEASFFTFTSGPPPQVSLSDNFVNSFRTDDLRKTNWVKSVTDGTMFWYHPYKYREYNSTAVSKEYSVVLRLGELYLIRAEARAQQGELTGAKEDLDKIRHRAGLNDTDAVTKEEVLNSIMQERRWELFTEQGHRFFDLKRFGQIDNALNALKSGWNTTDKLFPIPQTELSTNPNLRPQNPGY